MRRTTIIMTTCLMACSSAALAQDAPSETTLWRTDTALTAPKGRLEFGLFTPSRYALTDKVELQTDLLLNFALPNVGAQVHWTTAGGWALASKHTLRYSTRLLNVVTAEGVGGFLPGNITPPQMIEIDNEVMTSKRFGASSILTVDLGVSIAPNFNDGVTPSGSLPVIDFPFLYPRLASTVGGATLRGGVAWVGRIVPKLEYAIDVDVFYNTAVFLGPALEQGANLAWRPSDRVSLGAGYRLSLAQYAYGTRVHVLPTLDVRVGF